MFIYLLKQLKLYMEITDREKLLELEKQAVEITHELMGKIDLRDSFVSTKAMQDEIVRLNFELLKEKESTKELTKCYQKQLDKSEHRNRVLTEERDQFKERLINQSK